MAHPGSRILRVDIGVDHAVESHSSGARCDHRNDDPQDLPTKVRYGESFFADRQQSAGERERQREDRVLELDHLQREAKFAQKARGKKS